MKKLFVLFLLVALVPFTVGCSLWGNDEDLNVITPPVVPASWSASVVASSSATLSLRGAAPVTGDTYFDYSITIDGVTLPITDVTGNTLTFSKAINAVEEATKKAALAPGKLVTVLIKDAAGITKKTITYITTAAVSGDIAVDYTTGKPEVKIGTAVVAASDDAPANKGTISSVTGVDALGALVTLDATTAKTVVASTSKDLIFIVTADKVFDITKSYAHVVKVNGKLVASTDFELTQTAAQKTAKQATISLDSTKRKAGVEYEVVIENLIVDGLNVAAKTFKFKF